MSARIDQISPATRQSAGSKVLAAAAVSRAGVEPCDPRRRRETGFTLIELMITVVVISILAAIALPSYQSYVRQARRVEAQASLIDLQQDLEKWRVNNAGYSGCPSASCSAPASDYYNFSVTSADATSYSLQAAAKGTQVADTGCTPLTLDQDSAKGPAGCWKQ